MPPIKRPGRAPYYLVAADGSAVRHLDDDPTGYAAYLNNLSPKEANRAVVHTWNAAPGLDSLQVVDLKTGYKTPLVSTTVWSLGWSWNYPARRWLSSAHWLVHAQDGSPLTRVLALSAYTDEAYVRRDKGQMREMIRFTMVYSTAQLASSFGRKNSMTSHIIIGPLSLIFVASNTRSC